MSIGYCGRNRRFSSLLSVLNNHSNSLKSHGRNRPAEEGGAGSPEPETGRRLPCDLKLFE